MMVLPDIREDRDGVRGKKLENPFMEELECNMFMRILVLVRAIC